MIILVSINRLKFSICIIIIIFLIRGILLTLLGYGFTRIPIFFFFFYIYLCRKSSYSPVSFFTRILLPFVPAPPTSGLSFRFFSVTFTFNRSVYSGSSMSISLTVDAIWLKSKIIDNHQHTNGWWIRNWCPSKGS